MESTLSSPPPFARAKSWVSVGAVRAAGEDSTPRRKRQHGNAPRQPIEAASLPDALLKVQTVCAVVGLSSPTIYRKVATGDFPEPVRLGARCTRWKSGDVQSWLAAQTTTAASVK
ncbi:MAG: AlpA family phage regulatory protein [Rubrivivax sp.]|nr:AlpA family phage regulatory protein [Rubrivivax sp.]